MHKRLNYAKNSMEEFMDYWDKKIIREQLDKKYEVLKSFVGFLPQQGWIKTIREVLGLSAAQLGEKVGIDQSRISRLENAEKTGNLNWLWGRFKTNKSADQIMKMIDEGELDD